MRDCSQSILDVGEGWGLQFFSAPRFCSCSGELCIISLPLVFKIFLYLFSNYLLLIFT